MTVLCVDIGNTHTHYGVGGVPVGLKEPLDAHGGGRILLGMAAESKTVRYVKLLRRNPQQAAPALAKTSVTVRRLHAYKERLRAFDAARLELRLTTPAQLQRENSAAEPSVRPRILRFSRHA